MDEKEKTELAEMIAEAAATAVADSIGAQFAHFTDELTRKVENEIYELKKQLDRAATHAATERALFLQIMQTHVTNDTQDILSRMHR